MKLSPSLLQAITLGVSVAAFTATTTACSKEESKVVKERKANDRSNDSDSDQHNSEECIACGMG